MKTADTNAITRDYLDSILIEERLVDSVLPDTHVELFGETFDTPIMTPAFSHLKAFGEDRENAMVEYARGAASCNAVNWAGMEPDERMAEIFATGARTVRVIKPFADHEKVLHQIRFAKEKNAFAVGMDIDHVYGYDGKYDVVDDEQMGPVMMKDLKAYVAEAGELPFVVKGVLSVQDAVKCAACGVRGIVVSHHHGRLPFAVPPLMVLPDIADALEGSGMTIFVDCHMDTGYDAFKALALGADAVSVGNALMPSLREKGKDGVAEKIAAMNAELITAMGYSGCASVGEIEPSVLWMDEK